MLTINKVVVVKRTVYASSYYLAALYSSGARQPFNSLTDEPPARAMPILTGDATLFWQISNDDSAC